ncbi:MAG: alpha/beta hydrolase [Gammaproteobacteria bacterium]|nr:alpha/beta hydrolase [Gammaproteobacteria bacterium]
MDHETLPVDKTRQTKNRLFNSSGQDKRVVPFSYQMLGHALNIISYIRNEWAASIISDLWFTVFKSKAKPWTIKFWQTADACVELQLKDKAITVHLWGEGPLVVMMHGWSGSGSQFRKHIPGLVNAGYQVASFDAPAHGLNPGKQSHLLEFCDTLLAIEQQIGQVDTIMAHSFGAMAAVVSTILGFSPRQMILIGPHLDAHEMHQTYSELLNLNPRLTQRFRDKIEQKMTDIINSSLLKLDKDVWHFLSPASLLSKTKCKGLLIYDVDDEEIPQSQFKEVEKYWQDCQTIETSGLGHHRILKDREVIENVLTFMGEATLKTQSTVA